LSSTTRFGNLGRVFKDGESELLVGIARLSVLYEDLRLELAELHEVNTKPEEERTAADQYRVMYFLRRALSTLIEFRGGLTTVCLTQEFKNATLSSWESAYIARADSFLQAHWDKLKALRNEFGGHVKLPGITFATEHFSDVVGSVTWNRSREEWSMGLECDFAGHVVAGAISSKLVAGTDVRTELHTALSIISDGFLHAQAAMVALVHAFLWDRFGR
jgi:hypothetical protein